MSKKVRIHDLAKQYGMSGKDLAAKLRDHGFSQARSHMSALDEFEVLQVQGIMEAYGHIPESDQESGEAAAGGGLILRKKKKKKVKVEEEATTETAEEMPAPEAEPAPEEEPVAEVAPEPEPVEAVAAEPEAPPVEAEAPTQEPEPEVEVPPTAEVVEEEPPVVEAETAVEIEPEVVAEEEAPVAEAEAAPEVEVQPEAEAVEAEVKPKEKPAKEAKPKGRVVGFIDPASFQRSTQKKRVESRRLSSRDDVAPDVQPTFSHDKRKAMMRGAGAARGDLTAAQLREREQGRFLRRGRPSGPTGGGGRGGGRGRGGPGMRGFMRQADISDSPLKGTKVKIEEPITIKKIAEAFSLKAGVLVKRAMSNLGMSPNINSVMDEDSAQLLAHEFDIELEIVPDIAAEEALLADQKEERSAVSEEKLLLRPPTVAFLGHVDHGKTTLIDAIRSTQVADHEAGGITQHIGAYQVKTKLGHTITIIDTPGHATFTAMRARGAQAVDVVVLVCAGDDGVKPQTEEALNHARAAGTPIVVALTKSDKTEFNSDRAKQQLAGIGLNWDEWDPAEGVGMIDVSAMNGNGVEDLLERVFTEGEILELKAYPDGPATGVVLEAEIQQGKGIVAHLLVQDGTLKRGDVILAGEGYGRCKSIHDDRNRTIETAGPSMPVEVSGLDALPGVGDAFHVVKKLAKAKEVAVERERKNRAVAMAQSSGGRSAELASILGGEPKQESSSINVIVRADVQGSVEVIRHACSELPQHEEVAVKLLHAGVGAVTESDVDLAATSDARILAFHVGMNSKSRMAADRAGVEIARFDVIYEMLDYLKLLMEGALNPEFAEEITGHVEIRRLFKSSKIGLIAGCIVLDGTVSRDSKIRLLRDDQVVHTGGIGSLRRENDDAKTVREGFECGIVLKDFRDIREGDIVEAYKLVEVKRTLEDVKKS